MTSRQLADLMVFAWLICWTGFCYAAKDGSLAQDAMQFDWWSILTAMGAGLFGGALRTVLVLAAMSTVLLDVLREARKDIAFAAVGGIVIYGVILLLQQFGLYEVPRGARLLVIASAGFSRGAWFKLVELGAGDFVLRLRTWMRGGQPPQDPPPSAVIPLDTK
jgi:hypothetical protein